MEFEIIETKDYSQFVYIDANREIDEKHVFQLVVSIKRKNMLKLNPIIVGKNMEVIDGQHRIEAAKYLGEPIWYVRADDLDHLDIIALNNVKKVWRLEDYFCFFLIKKYDGYDIVYEYMKKYKTSLSTTVAAFSFDGKVNKSGIKNGVIDTSNKDNANYVLLCLSDYQFCYPYWDTVSFARSLRTIIEDNEIGYSREKFLNFLSEKEGFNLVLFYQNEYLKWAKENGMGDVENAMFEENLYDVLKYLQIKVKNKNL